MFSMTLIKPLKLKRFPMLLALLCLPLVACAESDAPYVEGKHYVELSKPVAPQDPSKIEVIELFWYGCPGCYGLEPFVEKWAEDVPADVNFVRMPAVLNRGWTVHAHAYYAAEQLGVAEKAHRPLFDAIHKQGQQLFDPVSLTGFYVSHGADGEAFTKAINSFSVKSKVNKARKKQMNYRAPGVPYVVVNGKYGVGISMKAGAAGLFDVVDYLVAKERAAK